MKNKGEKSQIHHRDTEDTEMIDFPGESSASLSVYSVPLW